MLHLVGKFTHSEFGNVFPFSFISGHIMYAVMDIAPVFGFENASRVAKDHCEQVHWLAVVEDPYSLFEFIGLDDVQLLADNSALENAQEVVEWIRNEVEPAAADTFEEMKPTLPPEPEIPNYGFDSALAILEHINQDRIFK